MSEHHSKTKLRQHDKTFFSFSPSIFCLFLTFLKLTFTIFQANKFIHLFFGEGMYVLSVTQCYHIPYSIYFTLQNLLQNIEYQFIDRNGPNTSI